MPAVDVLVVPGPLVSEKTRVRADVEDLAGLLAALGAAGAAVRSVAGGDIHQAARAELPDGPVFIKWNKSPTPGMFAAEAEGLEALRGAGIGVPRVLGVAEGWLALEWIERGPGGDAALGEGLDRSLAVEFFGIGEG